MNDRTQTIAKLALAGLLVATPLIIMGSQVADHEDELIRVRERVANLEQLSQHQSTQLTSVQEQIEGARQATEDLSSSIHVHLGVTVDPDTGLEPEIYQGEIAGTPMVNAVMTRGARGLCTTTIRLNLRHQIRRCPAAVYISTIGGPQLGLSEVDPHPLRRNQCNINLSWQCEVRDLPMWLSISANRPQP